MIVEDDQAVRDYYESALAFAGFDVRTAADGIQALEEIDRELPDTILLDLNLPFLNGATIQGALHLQEATRAVPIVVATGSEMTLPFPVVQTLIKPVDPERLVAAMFEALAQVPLVRDAKGRAEQRTVVWECPRCHRAMRESHEPGHPMTAEMRTSETNCPKCAADPERRRTDRRSPSKGG